MTEAELIQIIKQAAKDEVTELDLSNNQISSLPHGRMCSLEVGNMILGVEGDRS
jgi:Leucine-rich repeat (LRR) protein